MHTSTIHRLWYLVERSQPGQWLSLDDHELTQLLLNQLAEIQALGELSSVQEAQSYISNRLPLIRAIVRNGP